MTSGIWAARSADLRHLHHGEMPVGTGGWVELSFGYLACGVSTAGENWFWPTLRDRAGPSAAVSRGEEDAFAEQVEVRAAVHLSFEHLDPVDVAFDGAGAVGQGQAVRDGGVVSFESGGEGVQVG